MRPIAIIAIIGLFLKCGTGVTYSTASATMSVLNGPTRTAISMAASGIKKQGLAAQVQNGYFALSPSKMTMTITGIGFLKEGEGANSVRIASIPECKATYDRSIGSLVVLNSSGLTIPVGTFGGLVIEYSTTYTMVMNDMEAGIYSDPSVPNKLTTTPPAGGGKPIEIRDHNNPGNFEHTTLYFDTPLSVDKDSSIQIYVVFDPTHWIKASCNNGEFSAPQMSGSPPIIPSISSFGKAAIYSNIGTVMSFNMGSRTIDSSFSLLFLYADTANPVSVTWQDGHVCNAGNNAAVVSFNGNGNRWGTYGMLGLDAQGMLSWAMPGQMSSDFATITGYTGVLKIPELSTVGQVAVLQYHCTPNVPQPVSGSTYSSGAPDFAADDSLYLTLLAD